MAKKKSKKKFANKADAYGIIADDPLLSALMNKQTIDKSLALSVPVVAAAVDRISNIIACTPFRMYRERDGTVEQLADKRVSLFNDDSGDTLDGFQMKKAFVRDFLLTKGGYIYIETNRNRTVSLRYVESSHISVSQNNDPIFKQRKISVNGKEYEPDEFIIICRNSDDGVSGTGLISEIQTALQTALGMIKFQLKNVKTGGNKKGFIKSNTRLSDEAIKALKDAWSKMYSDDTENAVILNNGLEFQESSNSSLEMQLNQSKSTLNAEINAIFGISEDNEQFFRYAIIPIIKAIETALNKSLLLNREKNNTFWAADLSVVSQVDMKTRFEAWKIAVESGWATRNEIRSMENMEAIEGLDTISVSLGSVLLDAKSGKYFVPNTGQTIDVEGWKVSSEQPIDDNEGGE